MVPSLVLLAEAVKVHTSAKLEVKKLLRHMLFLWTLFPWVCMTGCMERARHSRLLCVMRTPRTVFWSDGSKKRSCSTCCQRCLRFSGQESGYTRMILKSGGKPSITALVTAVQKEWAGDCKDFLRQLILSNKSCGCSRVQGSC